jgi:hypothetical protein
MLWERALEAWVSDEKDNLKKLREETEKRKLLETQGALEGDSKSFEKRRKLDKTLPDPALNDDLEDRLWIGLSILKTLSRRIHKGVLNTSFLKSEPGCSTYSEEQNLVNTSLLVSVPRKLEPYPGRHGAAKAWMGTNAMRFYEEQRGTVPAEGAAPAAAPANLHGEDGDAPMPSSPIGADGPGTRSRVPEIFGKVRGFWPAVVLMSGFVIPMPVAWHDAC